MKAYKLIPLFERPEVLSALERRNRKLRLHFLLASYLLCGFAQPGRGLLRRHWLLSPEAMSGSSGHTPGSSPTWLWPTLTLPRHFPMTEHRGHCTCPPATLCLHHSTLGLSQSPLMRPRPGSWEIIFDPVVGDSCQGQEWAAFQFCPMHAHRPGS